MRRMPAAALVVSRAAGWRSALAFSFVFHRLGALAGGTAVAVTISSLVHASAGELPAVYAAAALAARRVRAGRRPPRHSGQRDVRADGRARRRGARRRRLGSGPLGWLRGARPVGVLGALAGLVASPSARARVPAGSCAAALVRGLGRGTRRLLRPVRGRHLGRGGRRRAQRRRERRPEVDGGRRGGAGGDRIARPVPASRWVRSPPRLAGVRDGGRRRPGDPPRRHRVLPPYPDRRAGGAGLGGRRDPRGRACSARP